MLSGGGVGHAAWVRGFCLVQGGAVRGLCPLVVHVGLGGAGEGVGGLTPDVTGHVGWS